MPTVLEIVRQARDTIVSEPESYRFSLYCQCLVGHVYLAATGQPYDQHREIHPWQFAPTDQPFGAALQAIYDANPHAADAADVQPDRIRPDVVSQINSHLAGDGPLPALRDSAVLALNNTIAHLEESS